MNIHQNHPVNYSEIAKKVFILHASKISCNNLLFVVESEKRWNLLKVSIKTIVIFLSKVVTKRCSLEVSFPKFLNYNEMQFLVLAKSLKNTFEGFHF